MGDFLGQDLDKLHLPQAVFIGGHGNQLELMVEKIDQCLEPGGRIVINAVQEDTLKVFEKGIKERGYQLLPALRLQVDDHNPITILCAEKK